MEYRELGRTGIRVSAVGLGTEYLNGVPRETVVSVVRGALDRGVNYIDVVFGFPEYRDNLAAGLQGFRRDEVVISGHLGSGEKDGQYFKTRDLKACQDLLEDQLTRMQTDYVDVLFLHNVNGTEEYEPLLRPGGVLDLALRLKQEGKARCIGLSGHRLHTAIRAVESGQVDVLMFPINLLGNAMPGKRELLQTCARRGVGLVAMKPYAGGKLFQGRRTINVGGYQTGGKGFKTKLPPAVTPVRCLDYVLSQVGVSTVVPGVKDEAELQATLAYLEATPEERDFSSLVAGVREYVEGECVYCNHCLPCPAGIDIGQVSRLVDTAGELAGEAVRAAYAALPARASDCQECGACSERCPFGVDALAIMRRAVALFEARV